MSAYNILAWQPLLRPPLPSAEPPAVPHIPLKALACRNSRTSLSALITAEMPVREARLVFSDLTSGSQTIPSSNICTRIVGTVNVPGSGPVCDLLFEMESFQIDKSAAVHVSIQVPADIPAGTYTGSASLVVDGSAVAANEMQLEVANVVLPDTHEWDFFLNVWMNPAAVARVHGVEVWSEEHFAALRPYIEDLAAHGQKTVVAPICYQPWGGRMRDPYPNLVRWTRSEDAYDFDFSIFDRYVELHADCGIDKAIHCYSVVQDTDEANVSTLEYFDADTSEQHLVRTQVGDSDYNEGWRIFSKAAARTSAWRWRPATLWEDSTA